MRYAPLVAADPPDGLVLDVAGAAHLHGGEAALAGDLVGRLERGGGAARWAAAGTWATAWALARYALGTVLKGGPDLDAITGLPVPALRLPADVCAGLRALGFETVADVAGAPRSSLTLRFGPTPAERLDMLAGSRPELFEPVLSPDLPFVRLSAQSSPRWYSRCHPIADVYPHLCYGPGSRGVQHALAQQVRRRIAEHIFSGSSTASWVDTLTSRPRRRCRALVRPN